MMGFLLGVGSALCWAGLDVVRKALAVFLLVGQVPFLGAWAAYDRTWISDAQYWR